MMRLAYHPAFDPYHATLRLLQIIHFNPLCVHERDRLRILDFFLMFPQQIKDIRLPRQYTKRQNLASAKPNPYHFSGTTVIVFNQMAPWQDAALHLLLAAGMISRTALTENDTVVASGELPLLLRNLITGRNATAAERLHFLVNELYAFPLKGKDGLKDRTGMLSYKYDSP